MALAVRWSLEAEETFDTIIEYLQSHWSEKEVRKFVQRTMRVIGQIETNPYLFKQTSFFAIRLAYITKHISLLYFVNETEGVIDLYSFWDNRKNPLTRPYSNIPD